MAPFPSSARGVNSNIPQGTPAIKKSVAEQSEYRAPTSYAFGPFLLDLQEHRLYRRGVPVDVSSKVLDILEYLLANNERLVSKYELVEAVWRGSAIGDSNIAQHVHMLRDLLNDRSRPYRYIMTVHGRGYRFIGKLEPVFNPLLSDSGAEVVRIPESVAIALTSNAAYFARVGTPASLQVAADLCRKALKVHPGFAEGHAELALVSLVRASAGFENARTQLHVARGHAEEALKYDKDNAKAHVAMALVCLCAEFSAHAVVHHFDAIASNGPPPPEAVAALVMAKLATKDFGAAMSVALDGLRNHPASTLVSTYLGFALYHINEREESIQHLERLLALRPNAAFATYLLALGYLASGRYVEARAAFHSILLGRASATGSFEKFRQRAIAGLVFIEARIGNAEDANALMRDLLQSDNCSQIALAMARAGMQDDDAVVAHLRLALEQRDCWLPFIATDPIFREYWHYPDFRRLREDDLPGCATGHSQIV